jgi:hypothetical protein
MGPNAQIDAETVAPRSAKKRGRPASGVAMRWQAYCECGWSGVTWGGTCRRDAYAELRWHKATECKLGKSST